ncbi:MAG: hypothetical protein MUC81_06930 [Bacteroidia bacterium]|jgi:hypothetical protein|nr:hypothetical protein [Bacteroidia bacterium]
MNEFIETLTKEDKILAGIGAVLLLYLIIMYIMQKLHERKSNNRYLTAKKEYEKAREEQKADKEKLINAIGDVYGHVYGQMVKNGSVWEGMPTNLLMIAKGKASSIKQSIDTNAIVQIWQYQKVDGRSGSSRLDMEVTIRNNEVIAWQEFKH